MERLEALESKVAAMAPIVESVAVAVAPSTAPVVSRVAELEQFGQSLIVSLESAFGAGKIGLPPAPVAPPEPPAAPGA